MPSDKTESAAKVIRILIVDDHPIVREGLAARILRHPDLEVCGEAEDVGGALALIEQVHPDVIVVDISLKGGCGLDLIKRVKARQPNIRMLACSMYDDSLYAERCIRAGAGGYLNKQNSSREIVDAIRQVHDGKVYVCDEVSQQMLQRSLGNKPTTLAASDTLSDREFNVYRLIGAGLDNRAIAAEMHLSIKTVETYRDRVKRKLGLDSGPKLVRDATQWFLENG